MKPSPGKYYIPIFVSGHRLVPKRSGRVDLLDRRHLYSYFDKSNPTAIGGGRVSQSNGDDFTARSM
jgi:hypothetical protein